MEVNAPIPSVPIVTPPVESPIPEQPTPLNVKKPINKILVFGILILLVILAGSGYYFLNKNTNNGPNGTDTPISVKKEIQIPSFWINCSDSRQVLEDGDKLYVACFGGVLVIDKMGNVVDQLSMVNGLGDSTATSIVKDGNILYVGSQDGVTKYNLISHTGKKISVKEGLVNGSNIKLALDGQTLWIATFNGVSKLDTKTDTLTNYTTELNSTSEKRNISEVLVTSKYVYFLELASAYSAGAVIQYNKSTNSFKTFRPADFGRVDQYARLDFNTIAKYENNIFVSDNREVFKLNEDGSSWEKIDSIVKFVNKDLNTTFSVLNLLKNQDSSGVLITSSNKIYSYNPTTNQISVFYDFGSSNTGVGIKYSSIDKKLWYDVYNQGISWLSALDLTTKQITSYPLTRPKSFASVVSVIDDNVIVDTDNGLFKYDLESNVFTPIYKSVSYNGDLTLPGFLPIPNTQEIFMYQQFCGQACEKPIINLYNYATGSIKEIVMPVNIMELGSSKIMGGISYAAFNLSWADFANNKVGFSYTVDGVGKYISYNLVSGEWVEEANLSDSVERFDSLGSFCNRSYTFKVKNSFSEYGCSKTVTNGDFVWSLEGGKVVETNKQTGQVKTLVIPANEPHYTPFEWNSNLAIKKITFTDNFLWVSTDRGLTRYNPIDQTYKLYSPTDGLLSINVNSFVVANDKIWVVTEWGGLSVIKE